jgi:hypothetical protein
MKQEIKIEVPTKWSAVTLKQYLALRKDLDTYAGEEEAITACLFHHLCKFPLEYIQQLNIDTYIAIKKDLINFFNNIDMPLQKFITIDGVEYGFEPDLSRMAYGAYVDISKYETFEINEKWAEIMSILYRPLIKTTGKLYDIKAYDGNIDGEKFMDVPMDVHFGTLFFLKTLLKDLLKDTQKSLTGLTGLPQNIKSVLEKNGNLTQALSNSHKTI